MFNRQVKCSFSTLPVLCDGGVIP